MNKHTLKILPCEHRLKNIASSGIFIVNFKHILYHISSVFISCFSQINVCWEWPLNKYMYSVRMLENI